MFVLLTKFLNNFNQWHATIAMLLKVIIAIGVFCLVAYLLTIRYIPSEISFGDTLIFILIFLSCALAYTAVSSVLIFFGITLSPLVSVVFNTIDPLLPAHARIGKKLPFPKISVINLVIAICLIYASRNLFLLHWKVNLYIALSVGFIALFYYPIYLNRQQIKSYSQKFGNLNDIIEDPEASKDLKIFAQAKLERLRVHINDSAQLVVFLILTPLIPMFFINDIGKAFLDYTMQQTGVRVAKATLYVKAPYAHFIDLPQTTTPELSADRIFVFHNVTVLFQGIGKNTLISYKNKDVEKKLVIPNEYLTVEQSQ